MWTTAANPVSLVGTFVLARVNSPGGVEEGPIHGCDPLELPVRVIPYLTLAHTVHASRILANMTTKKRLAMMKQHVTQYRRIVPCRGAILIILSQEFVLVVVF